MWTSTDFVFFQVVCCLSKKAFLLVAGDTAIYWRLLSCHIMEIIPNPDPTQTNKPLIRVHVERKFKCYITFQITPKRRSYSKQSSGSSVILRTSVKAICSEVAHTVSTAPYTRLGCQTTQSLKSSSQQIRGTHGMISNAEICRSPSGSKTSPQTVF